ncbi:putative iron-dependent peroxidase [Corynebacterium kutscheri]|uniref:Iron-dependent peroxidase n=1 Tax=Corynebacterium kutscheri TaxID=35755 RepID=A0AB38VR58_9CORY|nr:putative iron-dependent peroxidase [Corynebacterium kutscheri]
MMMEVRDELILREQEDIIGRDKLNGAPLSGGDEFSAPDFHMQAASCELKIPLDSHVAIVHPDNNNGARMLRRGYNCTEGLTELGRLEAGLFFIAFVRNPETNFIPVLAKMSGDALTEYLQHIATGLYIVPGGIGDQDNFVGERLFS